MISRAILFESVFSQLDLWKIDCYRSYL